MTATITPDKKRYPRAEAMKVANELVDLLTPFTERIIIAGSLRRRKPMVGDIELLFIPKLETRREGLFLENVAFDVAEHAINQAVEDGLLSRRPSKTGVFTWGHENKLAVHFASGIPVDFFSTDALRWWNALVCRTGGKENNLLITTTALRHGWSFEAYGAGFHRHDDLDERHDTTSERDVYEFIGLKYLEPWERQ